MPKFILQDFHQAETIEEFETKIDEGELTVIHFETYPNQRYHAGWWVTVHPEIFIRAIGTKDKLWLVYAFNIPIAPAKHFFKHKNERLKVTLFFPALPKDTTHIDIIETLRKDVENPFNFYNVSMDKIRNGFLKK